MNIIHKSNTKHKIFTLLKNQIQNIFVYRIKIRFKHTKLVNSKTSYLSKNKVHPTISISISKFTLQPRKQSMLKIEKHLRLMQNFRNRKTKKYEKANI